MRDTGDPTGEPLGRWWPWLLAALALALAMNGLPVPRPPETTYLLTAYQTLHPGFLANDWTYGAPQPQLTVFNLLAGLPMAFLSLETVGWLGRIACWTGILTAALRIGRRLGLRPVAAGLMVLLWLGVVDGMAIGVGWPIRCTPSSVSFVFGLWALDGLLAGRDLRAAVCLGFSVAVHQSAGLPFALGILGGMLALRLPLRRQAQVIAVSLLAALPGIVPTIGALEKHGVAMRAEWEYAATRWFPMHLGLYTFPMFLVVAVAATAGFAWAGFRVAADLPAARAMSGFLAGPVAVFLFGVLATVTGRYEWLIVYPFRVLPVFAPLFALLAMAVVFQRGGFREKPLLTLAAAVTLLLMPNPAEQVARQVRGVAAAWRAGPDGRALAMAWLAEHTPAHATVLMVPRDPASAYLARRAQVVHWGFPRMDRLPEARERLEALMGPPDPKQGIREAETRFDALSRDTILLLRERYGGDFLLTGGRYDFPLSAEIGTYRIYRLTPDGPDSTNSHE